MPGAQKALHTQSALGVTERPLHAFCRVSGLTASRDDVEGYWRWGSLTGFRTRKGLASYHWNPKMWRSVSLAAVIRQLVTPCIP